MENMRFEYVQLSVDIGVREHHGNEQQQ